MSKLPGGFCNLQFDEPIRSWDEAVPLGNGLLGSLLWGEGDSYRMSIDRGDLWDSTPYPGTSAPGFCYAELVRLAKIGETEQIRKVFDAPYYNVTPTKIPAGKLLFDFGPCSGVHSCLRLATAEAEITFTRPEGEIRLRSFLHARERAGFIRIEGGAFLFKVERPAFGIQGKNDAYRYDTFRSLCSLVTILLSGNSAIHTGEWMTQRNRPVYNPVYMYRCIATDSGRLHRLYGGEQHALRYQVTEYIRENYGHPLSLDSIAEEFGITSVYLSSWFKENTGMNLSVYLSNYRMEKAKEFLRTDRNIRIADLARKVGIPSVSTFIRQFKNNAGVTPEQYRKINDTAKKTSS